MMLILNEFGLECVEAAGKVTLFTIEVRLTLISRVIEAQSIDDESYAYRVCILNDQGLDRWVISEDGGLHFQSLLFVPVSIRDEVLRESHHSRLAVHPGGTKMFHDVSRHFWWPGIKKDVAEFVSRCLTCQQVKAEHKCIGGLLQPLPIPEWKWEQIAMDFVMGLPRSKRGCDAILVIVNRLTKSAQFLPIRTNDFFRKYIDGIIRLHGDPVSIISDCDPHFVSRFWSSHQLLWQLLLR